MKGNPMPEHPLKVPEIGESIREVQIAHWLKQEGQRAARDEGLVEIESDKATVELPAPVAGVVTKIVKHDGQNAEVGEVIGYLEEAAEAPRSPLPLGEGPGEGKPVVAESPAAEAPPPEAQAAAVAAALAEATGPHLSHLPEEEGTFVTPSPPHPLIPSPPLPPSPAPSAARPERTVPMSPIRRRIAERLVQAQQTAAILTTFGEIDMSAVIELRKRYREAFQERYGAKLGFLSFFVKAAIEGLKLHAELNAEIRGPDIGPDIVYRNYYDIGIAVGGGKGLVVPVLRDAQRMSFADIERAIADFAARARDNKLKLEELAGGTFTITNGGVYGSLLSTPILNPPQSGILGMHAIQDRPVARDGQVVIRPMMYVALSYDHRLVDGREAVGFLGRVKELVEDPARMLLES
jgi:2-oxoglutarate dehydrogenase E2 component (dihydrolipoamide succinyltransferase)